MLVSVALPVPVRTAFTYAVPETLRDSAVRGVRVRAPFGKRRLVGVVLGPSAEPPPGTEVKEIEAVLDAGPVLLESVLDLVLWIAEYYQAPIGEAVRLALPPRAHPEGEEQGSEPGGSADGRCEGGGRGTGWSRNGRRLVRLAPGQDASAMPLDRRAARLRGILDALAARSSGDGWMPIEELRRTSGASAAQITKLEERGWVETATADRPVPDR